MSGPALDLVVRYRKAQTYGVHALLGALETEPPPGPFALYLARTGAEVAQRVADGVRSGRTVLVAWSFYSPDAPAMAAELAGVRAAVAVGDPIPAAGGPAVEAGDAAAGAGPAGSGRSAPGPGSVLHLAGGVHATAEPLTTLRSGFDAVAVGEGETTFVRLARALAEGAGTAGAGGASGCAGTAGAVGGGDDTAGDWRSVPGLAWLDGSGLLRRSAPAVAEDLDRYPSFPFGMRLTGPIELTRGCIYACRFCQTPFMFRARFRHRSVAGVREHVREMRRREQRDVRFITPTSLSYGSSDETVNLDAVEELLAGIRAELIPGGRIFFGSFPSELRPEHVTPEAMRLLRRYVANDNVIIGAQSGSEDMLRRSHRGHGVAVIEEAVRIAVAEGFTPNVDLIFGMPGETEDEAMATVALAERLAELGARLHGHSFMPLPGTPWRDERPGRLTGRPLAALQRLTAQGRIYGSWERQRDIAHGLHGGRSEQAGHRIRRTRAAAEPADGR